jgi:hypothetical protein
VLLLVLAAAVFLGICTFRILKQRETDPSLTSAAPRQPWEGFAR